MNKLKENYLFFITIFLFIIIFTLFAYFFLQKNNNIDKSIIRLASLSPSITEYIYDTGLDKYLIADTTYCNYPEDAKHKEKIGSFNDVNYEQIAKLKINTVIIQQNMQAQKEKLESMGIKVIEINNNTINDILNTYDILGDAFNIKNITDKRKNKLKENIEKIKKSLPKTQKKYSAVISIFRNYGSEISTFTAAGGNNLYNDILEILNIDNPLKNFPPYTEISKESILKINPDFIFDMYHGNDYNFAEKDWAYMPLKAVKNNNVIILYDNYLSLPGPRINLIIEKFAQEYMSKLND